MKAAAAMVLAAFSTFTGWVLWVHGYFGFWQVLFGETPSIQVFLDLCIALVFVLGWMRADSQRREGAFWPYVVVTLFLGSIGPLLYLVLRPALQGERDGQSVPPAAQIAS